jgi:hypothetical protein
MRCVACNKALTDRESVRKDSNTGEYYDLCGNCYQAYKGNLSTLEDSFEVDKSTTLLDSYE